MSINFCASVALDKAMYMYCDTVKPVLRGHLWDKEKVAL
jgi:hypothetical protein